MRAPAFWYRPAGVLAWMLWPLGWFYGRITGWRMGRQGVSAAVPVICVGNFTAGGAGKTPTVIKLMDMLKGMGETPVVVSRGYGGALAGPLLVDPALHEATDCGDEPLLLARHGTTVVARDRVAGARLAVQEGATVIVLDDGMQNPTLNKDFTLAVVDGAAGLGNSHCLPAGPLRAALKTQLPHVDLVLVIGDGQRGESVSAMAEKADIPVVSGELARRDGDVAALRGKRLLAFAGIGRPEKFFSTLRDAGLDVAMVKAFADHHAYSQADLAALTREATERGLVMVTTEKDAVRLTSTDLSYATVGVSLETDDIRLRSLLATLIRTSRSVP